MAAFPILKTGALAQYPLESTVQVRTQSVQFLDGSRQSYRLSGPLRRWRLRLANVDEQELSALIEFVEQQQGAMFSFTDPVSGYVIDRCVLSDSGVEVTSVDELRNGAVLLIEEVA